MALLDSKVELVQAGLHPFMWPALFFGIWYMILTGRKPPGSGGSEEGSEDGRD